MVSSVMILTGCGLLVAIGVFMIVDYLWRSKKAANEVNQFEVDEQPLVLTPEGATVREEPVFAASKQAPAAELTMFSQQTLSKLNQDLDEKSEAEEIPVLKLKPEPDDVVEVDDNDILAEILLMPPVQASEEQSDSPAVVEFERPDQPAEPKKHVEVEELRNLALQLVDPSYVRSLPKAVDEVEPVEQAVTEPEPAEPTVAEPEPVNVDPTVESDSDPECDCDSDAENTAPAEEPVINQPVSDELTWRGTTPLPRPVEQVDDSTSDACLEFDQFDQFDPNEI